MILETRVVSRYLGLLMFVMSSLIVAVGAFAAVEHVAGNEGAALECEVMFLSAGAAAMLGLILFVLGKQGQQLIGQREALVLVALSWLLGAAVAAMPYWIWAQLRHDQSSVSHDFDGFVSCYFEAMSGLTTTGATVVQAISTLPKAILLWRALTHWLGGLGIVVLFVAVLPMLGVGSRRLYRIEAPGPSPEGVTPRMRDTARVLWLIYVALTLIEVIALRICGMDWFESVCHTFATLATGGFSTLDTSIAGFPSVATQIVIIVFMVLAGVNFSLYHQLLHRRWRSVYEDRELRVYLVIIAAATVIVTISVARHAPPPETGGAAPSLSTHLRDAMFQVTSIQTTTGFCSVDFDQWGFVAKATLLVLMFIGASAGSTGGGIKVVRIMIIFKVMVAALEHVYRPKVVRTLKIGKSTIDSDLKLTTLVYALGIGLLFAGGTVLLMMLESHQGVDITTAATASAATLNNIGPGLARVGATHNYAWFSDGSKVVMTMLMVLGRLEMFTIIVLFTPRFWQSR